MTNLTNDSAIEPHDGLVEALVAFGSNQGDSRQIYLEAKQRLASLEGVADFRASQPVETQPVTGKMEVESGQAPYLNSVFRISTSLDHRSLLKQLLTIEKELGRVRNQRWDARLVDLDLLLYGPLVLESKDLTLPHPRMSFRRFVLEPAVEIASDVMHPVAHCTLRSLLDCLNQTPPSMAVIIENDYSMKVEIQDWRSRSEQTFPKWTGKKNIFETNFFSCMHRKSTPQPPSTAALATGGLIAPQTIVDQWQNISLLIVIADIHTKDWMRISNRFAGPTLLLHPSLGWTAIETEINAAIEAAS